MQIASTQNYYNSINFYVHLWRTKVFLFTKFNISIFKTVPGEQPADDDKDNMDDDADNTNDDRQFMII